VNDDRVREGLEHLQGAAVEVIAALRAFLDVAEDLVKDPTQLALLAAAARAQAGGGGADTPSEATSKVERIPVV
jgi:hypothetical protein